MGLIERVCRALIYICVLALAYYLILWVLAELGIMVPLMVAHILGVILVLIGIIIICRLFSDYAGFNLFPPRTPRPPGT